MLRIVFKIILFPVTILLALCEGICSLAVNLSGIFFRLIAGVLILTGLLSYGFQLEPWPVAGHMIAAGAVFLITPLIGTVLVAGISAVKVLIRTIRTI